MDTYGASYQPKPHSRRRKLRGQGTPQVFPSCPSAMVTAVAAPPVKCLNTMTASALSAAPDRDGNSPSSSLIGRWKTLTRSRCGSVNSTLGCTAVPSPRRLMRAGTCRGESILRETELWCSYAAIQGLMDYPYEELRSYWRTLLLCQFHDILPGTSIAWAYREVRELHKQIREGCEANSFRRRSRFLPASVRTVQTGELALNASSFSLRLELHPCRLLLLWKKGLPGCSPAPG